LLSFPAGDGVSGSYRKKWPRSRIRCQRPVCRLRNALLGYQKMSKPSVFSSPVRARPALAASLLTAALLASPTLLAAEVKRVEPMLRHEGYSREHCMNLQVGSTLDFHFETAQPVDFNIHHHPDKGDTVFAVRQSVTKSLAKTLSIKDGGEYCFQWKNPADRPAEFPITLTYQVK